MNKLHAAAAVTALSIALAMAAGAQAMIYTFSASGNPKGGDGPEGGKATITTGTDMLTVVLTSTEADPTAIGQEVSSIEITLGQAPGTTTLSSQAGQVINISGGPTKKDPTLPPKGTVTDVSGPPTHWGVGASGDVVTLETAGNDAQMKSPINLIIGPGPYTNANSSITSSHPDQIQGPGTFVIDLAGDADPTVTSVVFDFGTGPDTEIPGVPGTVPEPATWAMMLLGVFGLGGVLRRRRTPVLAAA